LYNDIIIFLLASLNGALYKLRGDTIRELLALLEDLDLLQEPLAKLPGVIEVLLVLFGKLEADLAL
jgi:hypothetical protein